MNIHNKTLELWKGKEMNGLYISRVKIKNYRNFKNVDVKLQHKEIIIGENNVGKTNFLRALQLIFDQSFSDDDRMLDPADFNDSLNNPMENGEEIRIDAYISGFEDNKTILAILNGATYKEDEEIYLLITYKFYKHIDAKGNESYIYSIYMGNDEKNHFTQYERKYLNLKVIKALRDVESELKNIKKSPIKRIMGEYTISNEDLDYLSNAYKIVGNEVLKLEEIDNLLKGLNGRFKNAMGSDEFYLSLQAVDVDPSKVLSSMNLLMANRMPNDNSLGLNNILYIILMLYILRDKTIPSYILADKYDELLNEDDNCILESCYQKTKKGNYELMDSVDGEKMKELYSFMSNTRYSNEGVTLLAIEEPEAHLHPINQRLIYRDVINNNSNSVLLTTHSPHITAISPLESIVNLHILNGETKIHSTADLIKKPKETNDKNEYLDFKRYLDVKRGEIYLGKGVILVEGVAEEYLVPKMANLLNLNLDELGIVLCNINSTNFLPFVNILDALHIPYVVITDGDHYYVINEEKEYHLDSVDSSDGEGYLGIERMEDICKIKSIKLVETELEKKKIEMNKYGFFVGSETLEVDIMKKSNQNDEARKIIIETFNSLTSGGDLKKKRFKDNIISNHYWKCLSRIEDSDIGKGRFSQVLSMSLIKENIPDYIEKAITMISRKVKL